MGKRHDRELADDWAAWEAEHPPEARTLQPELGADADNDDEPEDDFFEDDNQGDIALVCPFCQVQGYVATKDGRTKKGISGGKATAAVLTGGASMLVTGLSRKVPVTQLRCTRCRMTWSVDR